MAIKSSTLGSFDPEHKESMERPVAKMESPQEVVFNPRFAGFPKIEMDSQVKEVQKDGKTYLAVSVFYDLKGREMPIEGLENLHHETNMWLSYLGQAAWELSREKAGVQK